MAARFSFPRICIALGFSDPEKLMEHARREAALGERFLEFRLDFLPQPESGVGLIRDFLKYHPDCSLLATCRRHQNHGRYTGSVEEEIQILSAAVDAGARAVDIEIESAERAVSKLSLFEGRAQLVVSYHNYEGTPALESVMRRMLRIPAACYKIVTTARKPSDNWRVLSLAKKHPKAPLLMLAMGEIGFPTRVLSALSGGMYTYATPSAAEGTAAGQVSARMLRQQYRVERAAPQGLKIYGVIADPVRHSISPAVHNRAIQSRRLAAIYLPFLVQPLQLRDFFLLADRLPVSAFSVTIPHKQKILRYLDVVDPLARRIGAVNTVWKKNGKWRGTNTDAEGIRCPLEKRLRVAKSSVLVVGNGGAARSAAFTLADAGAKVSITGRNADRVRALAKACGGTPLSQEQAGKEWFDVVIHATSLGMWPHVEECFFAGRIPGELVFDLVYTPHETELLKRAAAQGCEVIHGLEMFLEQAAAQFQLWTGESAPRAAMEQAAREALNHQDSLSSHKGSL